MKMVWFDGEKYGCKPNDKIYTGPAYEFSEEELRGYKESVVTTRLTNKFIVSISDTYITHISIVKNSVTSIYYVYRCYNNETEWLLYSALKEIAEKSAIKS